MGVRKKGRRQIVANGRRCVWEVRLDDDSLYHLFRIFPENKAFMIVCVLETKQTYMLSRGPDRGSGCWRPCALPFPIPKTVAPGFAAQVIIVNQLEKYQRYFSPAMRRCR